MARAEALFDRVLLIPFPRTVPDRHPNGVRLPLPGHVIATSTAGKRVTVSTGKSGRFTMFLAPGTYRLTGSSPRVHVNGQDALCRGASRSGQGWQVNARHRSLLLGTLTPCPPRARSGGP